ncbi:hypothetical protein ACS0TY_024972 [Phlomoides rotata]
MVMMAGENPNRHVVAVPYPGRGHINPMLNLCHLILHSRPKITISFVVTEEWLSLLSASPWPSNLCFATIPNVLPSEIGQGKDFTGFFGVAQTKMEGPVEKLLDRLQPLKTMTSLLILQVSKLQVVFMSFNGYSGIQCCWGLN